jgi:hypothetical protein
MLAICLAYYKTLAQQEEHSTKTRDIFHFNTLRLAGGTLQITAAPAALLRRFT